MQEREQCPLCLKNGLINYLQSYQINLEEAVVLCENKKCPYPLVESSSTATTFTRSINEITTSKTSEENVKIPDGQLALQTKVASHMKKFGHRLQKDAVGIQTGSPQLKKKSKTHILNSKEPYRKRRTPGLQMPTSLNIPAQLPFQQNGLQSFQNFKSFSQVGHISCATNGSSWSSCNGSEGTSDKDSLLDSSLDSLESNSSSSSNGSVGRGSYMPKGSKYASLQLRQGETRSMPQSLPNLQKDSSQTAHLNGIKQVSHNEYVNGVKDAQIKSCKSDVNGRCLPFTQVKSKTCVQGAREVQNSSDAREANKTELNQIHRYSSSDTAMNTCSNEKEHYSLRYPSVFPQWRNKDALCWLDVILCLAVHNETLKTLVFGDSFNKDSVIYRLFKAHNQASQLLQQLNEKCIEHSSSPSTVSSLNEIECVRNQTELIGESNENIIPTAVNKCACVDVRASVETLLETVREEVWNKLKCRLKCERGQHESPVFALPLLLKEDKAVEEIFRMNFRFEYKCSGCGKEEKTEHNNPLPTFPAVVDDFRICNPQHCKKCLQCGNTKDVRSMVYKKLPECLLMHFTEGLPDLSFAELQFSFLGNLYTVTGVVQYVNNPDHFIAWLRNPNENKWLKCDDLRPTVCKYRTSEPKFPSSQIHIVMWERLHTKPRICRQVAIDRDEPQPSENFQPEKKQLPYNVEMFCNESGNKKKQAPVKNINVNLVMSADSPCSTLSTESADSVLLPNFISSTPSTRGVLRPIPKPVCSVSTLFMNSDHRNSDNQLMPGETSTAENGHCSSNKTETSNKKGDQNVKNPNLLPDSRSKIESRHFADDETKLSTSSSKICGPKSLIEPSTVFCIPKKSSEQMYNVISTDAVDTKQTVLPVIDKPSSKSELSISKCDSVVKESQSGLNNSKLNGHKRAEGEKYTVEKLLVKGASDRVDLKTNDSDPEKKNGKTSASKKSLVSRFKVPLKTVKRPLISRDAFFTIEPVSNKADSNACNTPVSEAATSSPGLNGNLTFFNSVKQYLLSRTTGRTEQKFKFEGLNLKSASNRSSCVSLSELDLPTGSNVSSNSSEHPVCNTISENVDTKSSISASSRTSSLSTASAQVRTLIESLDHSSVEGIQNPMILKRKIDSMSVRSPKKRFNVASTNSNKMSNETASLKENSVNHSRKRAGGKSMNLIRKQMKKAEWAKTDKSSSEIRYKSDSKVLDHKRVDSDGIKFDDSETKCDTDTVLQDLYEALNIPFSSVNSTLSDIMSDVDDILNFVSVGDVLPGQLPGDRPSSCVDGSFSGNQKHSDCWIRRPGRNSA